MKYLIHSIPDSGWNFLGDKINVIKHPYSYDLNNRKLVQDGEPPDPNFERFTFVRKERTIEGTLACIKECIDFAYKNSKETGCSVSLDIEMHNVNIGLEYGEKVSH